MIGSAGFLQSTRKSSTREREIIACAKCCTLTEELMVRLLRITRLDCVSLFFLDAATCCIRDAYLWNWTEHHREVV